VGNGVKAPCGKTHSRAGKPLVGILFDQHIADCPECQAQGNVFTGNLAELIQDLKIYQDPEIDLLEKTNE
jgi:hypothetical protein